MTKKYRAPLLLLAVLTLLFSTAEIVTSPVAVQAGTKVENPGKDMDGDPENWGDSPRIIDNRSPNQPVEPTSPLLSQMFELLVTWLAVYLRLLR